ncbi:MAG TPA: antibiotic biosynthesis monooxygenase [Blastocatellia bacterium]|jgi:heme-degrading monooxygenase HmoA|nr:antibiotic biosynthesis monooxygenase [Blastocatellia bacterium]
MILAISRFKVINGLEQEVKEAFFNRPRLVDKVAGFLGMETFTLAADPTIFYLLTRWTDAGSFWRWHSSEAHRVSHKGIPRGLKLDPSFTEILVLERITEPRRPCGLEEIAADHAPLFAQYLTEARTVHIIIADPYGVIKACNPVVADYLKLPTHEVLGRKIWGYLNAEDVPLLKQRIEAGGRNAGDRFPVNFVDTNGVYYLLKCHLDVQPDGFVLIGEPPSVGRMPIE